MSLRANTVANYLGQGWIALMGLVFIPVYIQYLGVEAWGLVGFMSMLQAWFVLLDMGLTPTLSREMARFQAGALSAQGIRDLLRSMEFIYAGVALTVLAIVLLIATWITSQWLTVGDLSPAVVTDAVRMMALVLATRMVEQVYRGAIQGLQRQVWLNGAQAVLATLRWAGALGVLTWVEASIDAFFLWQGIVSLLGVAVLAGQTYRCLPSGLRAARFDHVAITRIRGFAGGMAATVLLSVVLMQLDKLMLSKLLPLADFGYYTLATSVAGVLYFLMAPIVTAVSPRLTELVAGSENRLVANTYHQACQWLAAILVPIALTMAVFAEELLTVWSGDTVLARHVAPIMALLALGTLCNGLMNVPYTTQLAHGWTSFAVYMNLVAVCIFIPALLWAVPRYGALGAAGLWLTLNGGYLFIAIHFMHRRLLLNEKGRWYVDAVFKPLGAGGVMTLALHQWIEFPQSRVFSAALLGAVGLATMIAVFWVVPATRDFLRSRFGIARNSAPIV